MTICGGGCPVCVSSAVFQVGESLKVSSVIPPTSGCSFSGCKCFKWTSILSGVSNKCAALQLSDSLDLCSAPFRSYPASPKQLA